MSYGWIAGRPSKGICSEYNTQLWKTLGNITFSPPSLRRLISGAHLEADPVLWLKQVRLLSNRNAELTRLGHCLDLFETALSRNVLEGFEKHGWTKCRGTWRHEHCGHFLERDISHLKEWKKIAHKLRDSVRWSAWEEFKVSGRHEIAGLQLPQMTIERINMTRKWASTKPSRCCFAMGAVKSPKMAALVHGCTTKCLKCETTDPDWDHGWTCLLQVPVPCDTMLRRFLWGTNKSEQLLADSFIAHVEEFYMILRGNLGIHLGTISVGMTAW
jgi:hypothetical protein